MADPYSLLSLNLTIGSKWNNQRSVVHYISTAQYMFINDTLIAVRWHNIKGRRILGHRLCPKIPPTLNSIRKWGERGVIALFSPNSNRRPSKQYFKFNKNKFVYWNRLHTNYSNKCQIKTKEQLVQKEYNANVIGSQTRPSSNNQIW